MTGEKETREKPIQVVFKGEALDRLEKLRESYGVTSTSELVRDGIKVLAALENLKEPDGTITVAKGGKYYRIVLT
jgi:hypothetical protein